MIRLHSLLGMALLTLLTGCSWQQAFLSAQGWQRNQCYKLPEQIDRERCLASNSMSYSDYRRNTETGTRQD